MSANPEQRDDLITVTIDGTEYRAAKGESIIKVADDHGIDIPRFCYHPKLTAPANCRMCLVDVEMNGKPAPKPLPACITAIGDGMVVRTESERAVKAQRGVMEFLLINHPLDCPICDQGGECELQDLALGYGRGISRFTERKRVVDDEDLGPLVETEMTRCIHCTRCVRFLDEIAGTAELGALHRGEHTEIGTFVGRGVHSELSGNIIDLCPVGALTNKPYRYTARAWEMLSHPTIGPHDAIGSNISLHQVRGTVKRVVPRDNEAVNETWIADRDRYSYQGIYAEDRLHEPMMRHGDQWHAMDWQDALESVAGRLKEIAAEDPSQIATWVSPSATLEEQYLLARLTRGLGSDNIDVRLRQADTRDGASAVPGLGMPIAATEDVDAALLVGSYTRHDQPLLNHRLRKAGLGGAHIMALDTRRHVWNYELSEELVAHPDRLARELALIAAAAADYAGKGTVEGLDAYSGGATPGDEHQRVAQRLVDAGSALVMSGDAVELHQGGADLRALTALIAELTGAHHGQLGTGANALGGWIAGAVPNRGADGVATNGMSAAETIANPRRCYVMVNLEPEHDCFDGAAARRALDAAETVIVFSPYATETMREYADVILPIGAFGETAGTFVNAEGRWQTFAGVGRPIGEARPAWRVLRVLGNLLSLGQFEYNAPDEIHAELHSHWEQQGSPSNGGWQGRPAEPWSGAGELSRTGNIAIYGTDPLVRRGDALQRTPHAGGARPTVSPATAEQFGVNDGDWVTLGQEGASARLPISVDEAVADGTVWLPAGLEGTAGLGPVHGPITIQRA
jgi:NADH-quinone oxidoreductase subunit G